MRPDFIGALVALHGDGRFTQVAYFTSEAAAREAEADRSPEAQARVSEMLSLIEDPRYFDIREPWLYSPR